MSKITQARLIRAFRRAGEPNLIAANKKKEQITPTKYISGEIESDPDSALLGDLRISTRRKYLQQGFGIHGYRATVGHWDSETKEVSIRHYVNGTSTNKYRTLELEAKKDTASLSPKMKADMDLYWQAFNGKHDDFRAYQQIKHSYYSRHVAIRDYMRLTMRLGKPLIRQVLTILITEGFAPDAFYSAEVVMRRLKAPTGYYPYFHFFPLYHYPVLEEISYITLRPDPIAYDILPSIIDHPYHELLLKHKDLPEDPEELKEVEFDDCFYLCY